MNLGKDGPNPALESVTHVGFPSSSTLLETAGNGQARIDAENYIDSWCGVCNRRPDLCPVGVKTAMAVVRPSRPQYLK
jgi:hypothetical protein